ncbi:MAG: sterol desaturase family protein [Sphingomonadaceae bacterium]|nr:sterol desaturase family protein [Sphingomonadaceae bacterium]
MEQPHTLVEALQGHFIGALTFDFTRYLIAAGVMTLVLLALPGWVRRRRIQKRKATRADYLREFFSSLRTVFVFAVTTLTTLAMRETGFLKLVGGPVDWGLLAVQLGAMVLLHDAYFYWMHRALHHKALFRATHLHHHKSRTPTPWAAYSFSAWEAVAEAAFVPAYLLVLALAGLEVHFWVMLAFLWHMLARNVMGHAGVELFPRFWVDSKLTDWITTTTHHDLHHSEGSHNFGLYFTWWDRWMGTEHPQYKERFREVVSRTRPGKVDAVPAE